VPNISIRLLELAQKFPNKEIIHFQETGQEDAHLNYEQLIKGSARYASTLKESGVKQGEVVILILQQGLDLVYSYFGTILNGSIPSIMPFLTEKLLPEKYRSDLVALIEITKPAAIITYQEFSKELENIQAANEFIKSILFVEMVASHPTIPYSEFSGIKQKGKDVVLLQHSSGTTGLQKGVALSHQAVFNQLDSYTEALHICDQDVIVSWLPLYHDMGLIACFLMPILYSIPMVFMSPFDWVRAPQKLFHAITKYCGTLCWLPNFAYNFLSQKIRPNSLEGINLSSLRAVINCSEPMRFESHQLFLEAYMPYGLKPKALATCYAMAENVFAVTQDGIDKIVTYDEIDLETFQRDRVAQKPSNGRKSLKMVSAGFPIENSKVRIINEKGQELPDRHLGEIVLQSNCMLNGYFNREDETRKSFIDGWFKTGDLGYLADGELYISGRKKDLIIVGGKNIYPQDIEAVVNTVEGVHAGRSVAFGIFDEEKGTEEVVVVAEVHKGFEPKIKEIAGQIRRQVTRNSAVALRNVYLVDKFWLIKTSSGKIARSANKEKYLQEIGSINKE